eukprot:9479671-Lingulodinium_polyedra.AAC.1
MKAWMGQPAPISSQGWGRQAWQGQRPWHQSRSNTCEESPRCGTHAWGSQAWGSHEWAGSEWCQNWGGQGWGSQSWQRRP